MVEVWPENWPAVQLFAAVQTQWRVHGFTGRPLGLDYPAVEAAMRMLRIKDRPATFERIRIMEAAALATLNKG